MSNLVVSLVGTVIALVGGSSYVWSIIKGRTKPHRISWGVWMLAGILGIWASHDGGAGAGLLVTATFAVIVTVTFALSLFPRYGKPGSQRSDWLVGLLAIVGLLAWRILHFTPAWAATLAVAADAMALWP